MLILPYSDEYRDDMIFMVLEAKDALGRIPRLNDDLLDVPANYLDRGDAFFIAVEGGRVIGCGGYSHLPGTAEAFIHRLYVKASRKRRGIGTALLSKIEAAMRESGVTAARVHLGEPEEQWFESYSFYPKHGYKEYAPGYMIKELKPKITIGDTVTVTVDRPLGSFHPQYKDLHYTVNYGYIEGILAPDGEWQDAYILGVGVPVGSFTGKLIALINRRDDVEEKWVVCPEDMSFTKEEIEAGVRFQEQFFDSEVIVAPDPEPASIEQMNVKSISDPFEKQRIARIILEALPEWFGIPEAREDYIRESAALPFFAAYDGASPIGFVCLKETGRDTAELFVTGVLKEYHRKGAGRLLFEEAKEQAKQSGYSFLQVKTVRIGKYSEYDATNRFYLAMGFKEFEVFPSLWDEANPCQIYVMSLL